MTSLPSMPRPKDYIRLIFIVINLFVNRSFATYGVPPLFGEFVVKLNYINNCNETVGTHISVHDYENENRSLIHCRAKLNLEIDGIQEMHSVYLWGNGGWKLLEKEKYSPNAVGSEKNVFLQSPFRQYLMTIMNCPINKTSYNCSYGSPAAVAPNCTEPLLYGRYKSVLNVSRVEEPLACVVALFTVAPSMK